MPLIHRLAFGLAEMNHRFEHSTADHGEITGLELVEQLLLEELTFREDRPIWTALRIRSLNTIKTLTG